MTKETLVEFYVRCRKQKPIDPETPAIRAPDEVYLCETVFHSMTDVVEQFIKDSKTVSALKTTFDDSGRMISSDDVTESVINMIKDNIVDGQYNRSPHPLVNGYFDQEMYRRHEEFIENEYDAGEYC